jgi:hypothetical protein
LKTNNLPLKELKISEIYNGNRVTYEVPIYQRNYAWEKDEISALIQDVYDAYIAQKQAYFLGTLVTFNKGDQIYEVIDGQQRLTTINLVLKALKVTPQNKLTYRARKKSNDTINSIPDFDNDEIDIGIVNGYKFAEQGINEIVPNDEKHDFSKYFQDSVHLIHYQVPKDIDLNHYFEIMNSRGEQLEKHEIIKARLIEKLKSHDKTTFSQLWESCSEMNVYIQQKYQNYVIFGDTCFDFKIKTFDDLPNKNDHENTLKINDFLTNIVIYKNPEDTKKTDTFQPIIDFSNFILIVLKITRMEEDHINPTDFNLDDKDLIREFDRVDINEEFVKKFGFNLLKSKFFLDNYLAHHSDEDDTLDSNPWKLQYWQKEENGYLKNLDGESEHQNKLVQLLSMFEVSFTAKQRKNYLFYCLMYLFSSDIRDIKGYCEFVSNLAEKFFKDVYLEANNLNEINTPKPGSFDSTVFSKNVLDLTIRNNKFNFSAIYGDGTKKSKGVPLFIFNYLDYKLWEKYLYNLRGTNLPKGHEKRNQFFEFIGCNDFSLDVFDHFYFSRTRRSLEHYYPQANATGINNAPNEAQINCLGNFAMIGSEANSSGSNWTPKVKLDHYLDTSGKIKQVSVASLKFFIMMQKCKDNQMLNMEAGQEWNYQDIKDHQEKMLAILFAE